MAKEERAEMYRAFLADEGYTPRIDDDGDVVFKYEGRTFCIVLEEEDEGFFQLVLPNFWSIDTEAERQQVFRAAVAATKKTKVAKVYPVGDNTFAAIELFCAPPEVVKAVFRRCLRALAAAVQNFGEAMQD
jgi:hypothetical protein